MCGWWQGLTDLTLSGNRAAGCTGATALAEALLLNITLQSLAAERMGIGEKGMTSLAMSVGLNTSLTRLSLTNNAWTDDGQAALTFGNATRSNSALTDLQLLSDGCGWSAEFRERQKATEQEQLVLCKHLGRNRALRFSSHGVALACTTCEQHGATHASQHRRLITHHSRKMGCCVMAPPYTPYTPYTPTTPSATSTLAAGAASFLTTLDVTRYMLGDEGVAVLMKAIAAVPSLTMLDLRDNLIGSDGATSIGAALQEPACAVQTLLLGGAVCKNQRYGGYGAYGAHAECCNDRISRFTMRLTNSIGDKGATSLAKMLAVNTSLTRLVLDSALTASPPQKPSGGGGEGGGGGEAWPGSAAGTTAPARPPPPPPPPLPPPFPCHLQMSRVWRRRRTWSSRRRWCPPRPPRRC